MIVITPTGENCNKGKTSNHYLRTCPWNGYAEDGFTLTFESSFALETHKIKNSSYPQIHHAEALQTETGWRNRIKVTDANGKEHNDRIPPIRLYCHKFFFAATKKLLVTDSF